MGRSRKEIKEKIIAKQAQIKKGEIPQGWSIEAADFINRLLQRKPANRLGLRGAQEVKEHAWFKYYPWKELYQGQLESPFIPRTTDNFDFKYCNAPDRLGINTQERYSYIMRDENYKEVFANFYYFNREHVEREEAKKAAMTRYVNPHVVYLDQNERGQMEHSIKSATMVSSRSIDEKYGNFRKLSGSHSAATLIKTHRSGNHSISSSSTSFITPISSKYSDLNTTKFVSRRSNLKSSLNF